MSNELKSAAGLPITMHDLGLPTALEFWKDVVVPSYGAYLDDPSLRNTLTIATWLWHLPEWMAQDKEFVARHSLPGSYIEIRAEIRAKIPDFSVLGDISETAKHATRTQKAPTLLHLRSASGRGGVGGYGLAGPIAYGSGQFELIAQKRNGDSAWISNIIMSTINIFSSNYFIEYSIDIMRSKPPT